jgi:hypothetical protein
MKSMLHTLLDYDAQRSSELVKTLARFLDSGGNYDVTTKSLFIGRSTLKYRLQRIRDLSGHDLNDPDTRLNLHLATRAWQMLYALASVDATLDSARAGHPNLGERQVRHGSEPPIPPDEDTADDGPE